MLPRSILHLSPPTLLKRIGFKPAQQRAFFRLRSTKALAEHCCQSVSYLIVLNSHVTTAGDTAG
jgi:hypothetical protein